MNMYLLQQRNIRSDRGFTLMEMMIIIAILGFLAMIILGSLNEAREKARDAKRLEHINTLVLAVEAYLGDYGAFPGEGDTGGAEISPNCDSDLRTDLINGGYVNDVPEDPIEDSNCFDTGEQNDDAYFYGWDSTHCCEGSYCIAINRLETDWAIDQLEAKYPDNDGDKSNGIQFATGGGDANIGTGGDFNYCFMPN